MRENRTHGSEGREAKAFLTPITVPLQSRKLSDARAMIGLLAFDWKYATIREVGNVFNRDDSTIRFGMHRLRQRLKECEGLQNQLEELKRLILA